MCVSPSAHTQQTNKRIRTSDSRSIIGNACMEVIRKKKTCAEHIYCYVYSNSVCCINSLVDPGRVDTFKLCGLLCFVCVSHTGTHKCYSATTSAFQCRSFGIIVQYQSYIGRKGAKFVKYFDTSTTPTTGDNNCTSWSSY